MLQISVMLGVLVGGWLSDRAAAYAPHRRMLLYGVFYLVGAPFLLLFLGGPDFWVVAAGISAFSFLRGIGQANDNPTPCEIVPPQYRSTGIGFMNVIATASGGCAIGQFDRKIRVERSARGGDVHRDCGGSCGLGREPPPARLAAGY